MQQNDPMNAANQVARELNQPEGGKGARRLAEALSVDDAIGIVENYGTHKRPKPVVSSHPAETPMRMALLNLQARVGAKSVSIHADLKPDGDVQWWVFARFELSSMSACRSGATLSGAIASVVAECDANRAKYARENTIRARIEREMAEADAAEKALSSTAPLAFPADPALMFVPDGSVGDVLPIASIGPSGIGGYAQVEIKADTRGGGS